ncbi:lytic transglycosylase domain-containing protein [Streptomyces sp. NPDC059897]|uniref:lytic transglycosylase domain-containing protein n=1 Tax=Streptomyces sp. NPDC059897 TaxID=3346994 RepID=UPI00365E6656
MSRRPDRTRNRRRTLLWHQILTGAVAVAATGGMATATVWQLADMSPVAATSATPSGTQVGGGSPPLYPQAPTEIPGTRPVPFKTEKRDGGKPSKGLPALPSLPTTHGIPGRVLAAYRSTVEDLAAESPRCGVRMPLLAAVGRVESGHARGGALDGDGRTRAPILGPRLDGGPGVAAIHDSDGGTWDGDRTWDRAVGPAQFIPSTWRRWGSDGDGDGARDPHQIDDAWLSAGRYLCAAGGDLTRGAGIRRAVLAYNHSDSYLELVLSWMRVYGNGAVPTAGLPGDGESRGRPGKSEEPGKGEGRGKEDGKRNGEEKGKGKGGKESGSPSATPSPSPSESPSGDGERPSKPKLPSLPSPTFRLPTSGHTPSPLFPSRSPK